MEKIEICISCGSTERSVWGMKDGYTLLRCARCGLVAVSPIPPSTNEIYAAPDYFSGAAKGFGYVDYDADKEAMRGVFQEYLAQAEKLLPMKDKLLDVGAATGFFVALAEARGWKGEGIEVSDYAAAKGRDRGLRIITGTLESVALVPGTYGVVTMFDVIEHVRDPRTAISLAADVLGKNGVLLVTTPDAGSVLARLLRAHWHLVVPPEHLYYFTKQSMTVLLESLGFDTISITHPGKRFTLRYFFATVARWCPVPPLPWLADYFARHAHLGDRSIPFNTYDNLFVVAHKR